MMSPIKGIKKLPVSIKRESVPNLFMKLATVSAEISRLDEKLTHSIVKGDLVNTLALKESVQSTKIEGTQVTFTDMVNEKHILKQKAEHIEVLNYRKALSIGQERIQNGYPLDRKSTRLNSSHVSISYAVFCLKKKKKQKIIRKRNKKKRSHIKIA